MMRKARHEDQQARKAALREAFARKKRRKALLWRSAAVLIVLGAATASCRFYTQRASLDAARTTAYLAGTHAAGPINYLESPPMGGPHNVVWQNCGIYDAPIHNEHAVHSLEHGAVWITYRPGLPPEQVQTLKAVAADDYVLLSPYPGLTGQVVASSWNHQITLDDANDPRLPLFIAQYKNNPQTTPEFGAPCAGGTRATAAADTLNATPGGMIR